MEDTFVGLPGPYLLDGISSTEPRTDGIATAPWADVAQVVKEPLCSVFVKSPVSSNSEVGTSPWSYGYGRKVVRGVFDPKNGQVK